MLQYLGNSFRPLVDGAPVADSASVGVCAHRERVGIAGDRPSNLYFPRRTSVLSLLGSVSLGVKASNIALRLPPTGCAL